MPADQLNFLEWLAANATDRLNSMPFFSDITVRDEQLGDSKDAVKKAADGTLKKGGKTGAVVIVHFPDVIKDGDQSPVGGMLKVQLVCEVYERVRWNRTVKGTNKWRGKIAANVLQALKGYYSEYIGMTGPLYTEGRPITAEMAADDELRLMVRLHCYWPFTFAPKVARLNITAADVSGAVEVSIACGTAGALIYYTTDGSYPGEANATAVLYDAPFTVTEAMDIRAIGYKPDYTPSDEALISVSVEEAAVITDGAGNPLTTGDNTPIREG